MIGFDSAAFRRGFWRGAAAGAVAGATLALLLASPPAAGSQIPGDGPALAVATSGDGATITLHGGAGICLGEALAAVWRPGHGSAAAPVPGCWLLVGEDVLVSFLDGERANIPVRVLVRAGST